MFEHFGLRVRVLLTVVAALSLFATACGSDAEEYDANATIGPLGCTIERSELGPFSSDERVGSILSEDEAKAQAAETGFDEWIAIEVTGPWETAWDIATEQLGQNIHQQLAWFDVDGQITGLYEEGEALGFEDVRVSRSLLGDLYHDATGIFIGVNLDEQTPNYGASCEVTSIRVFEDSAGELLDIFHLVDATGAQI